MQQVISLARQGYGKVSPNPLVGCLLVKDGVIIAKGAHKKFGGPHAEVNALSKVDAQGTDLYVNLEPCNHHGKTPPCTENIIESGVKRVFIGMEDPNPLVAGSGIKRLKQAGLEVVSGICEDKCRKLNEAFITFMKLKRPFVTLKIAQTLDGKIALPNGRSQWITGPEARRAVHRMRSRHDAVLTGIGTVIADDCQLDVRNIKGVSPKRIVLDTLCDISLKAKIINKRPQNTVLAIAEDSRSDKIQTIRALGVTIWPMPVKNNFIDIHALLNAAYNASIQSIMIEAGPVIAQSFIKAGFVDKIITFIAPKIFGNGLSPINDLDLEHPDEALKLMDTSMKKVGSDYQFTGYLTCLPD